MIRFFSILAIFLCIATQARADITGPARVVDGDTILIGGLTINLYNIDAPEPDQMCHDADGSLYPCGQRATNALVSLTLGQFVRCLGDKTDKQGHLIRTCYVEDMNINQEMVLRGWALVYRQKKFDEDYLRVEQAAKKFGIGIWRGEFETPWDWRNLEKIK